MKKTRPPKVKMRDAEPLQDYYQDRDGNRYSVAKLIDDAKKLPVFDVPLAALDLSDVIWQESSIFALAFNCKKVMDADLSKPILLDWNGTIADGRHRIIKAIALGRTTIKAKRIQWKVTPDSKGDPT